MHNRKKAAEICYDYGMKIILCHNSALEYWRLHGNKGLHGEIRQRRRNLPAGPPDTSDIRGKLPSGLSCPVNLLVGSPNARRSTKLVRPRVYAGLTPDDCFVSLGADVTVSAPAFCFFQMAGELPLVKLIELGCELCGSYSIAVRSPAVNSPTVSPPAIGPPATRGGSADGTKTADRNVYDHAPLTNTKALKAFVDKMEGIGGQKKARSALRHIADGSASPMETILFMLLTLPQRLGGYGLPAPALNKQIELGTAAKQRSGKAYYVCDLFWPEANLAVEYDSDTFHTGAARITDDSKKRLHLAAHGVHAISVTGTQIRNVTEFESLARLIAEKLGKELRYKNPRFPKARRELRDLLLPLPLPFV